MKRSRDELKSDQATICSSEDEQAHPLKKVFPLRDHSISNYLHKTIQIVRVRLTCHGIFPPSSIRVRSNRRTDDETSKIHGRADHRHSG